MQQPRMSQAATAAVVVVVMAVLMDRVAGQMVRFFDEKVNVEEGDQFTVRVELLGTITENIRVIVEVRQPKLFI